MRLDRRRATAAPATDAGLPILRCVRNGIFCLCCEPAVGGACSCANLLTGATLTTIFGRDAILVHRSNYSEVFISASGSLQVTMVAPSWRGTSRLMPPSGASKPHSILADSNRQTRSFQRFAPRLGESFWRCVQRFGILRHLQPAKVCTESTVCGPSNARPVAMPVPRLVFSDASKSLTFATWSNYKSAAPASSNSRQPVEKLPRERTRQFHIAVDNIAACAIESAGQSLQQAGIEAGGVHLFDSNARQALQPLQQGPL